MQESKVYKKIVNAWCMYDWANSAFATTIMAAVLPTFYSSVASVNLEANVATAYWGYTTSIAMLIVAVSAPILGAMADYTASKRRFLAGFAILGIVFTCLLVLVSTGDWLLCAALYILGSIGFSGANVFYDSLLPHVAKPEEIDQVSTKGYALGYLGGGLLLAVNIAMIMFWDILGFPSQELATRWTFVTVGIWWAIFSIPIFRHVPEPEVGAQVPREERISPVVAGVRRVVNTFRDIKKYRQLFKFIVAFWLYNDGIGTIIKMATIYGTEIGIGQTDLIGALLLTQFVGIPFSFAFGSLAKRIGSKRSIYLGLGVYTLISVWGYFMHSALEFWLLAGLVGLVQGGSQALSRSLFGSMCPKAKTGEFFGFYDVSSKFAGIAGPFLFAVVGQLTGSSRLSIVSLIVFFIGGALLLTRVDEKEGVRIARSEDQAMVAHAEA